MLLATGTPLKVGSDDRLLLHSASVYHQFISFYHIVHNFSVSSSKLITLDHYMHSHMVAARSWKNGDAILITDWGKS